MPGYSLPVRPPSLASQLPQLSVSIAYTNPVGAGLPALNDDAISNQNSRVLDNVTCRESPIDTKNRLAAEG